MRSADGQWFLTDASGREWAVRLSWRRAAPLVNSHLLDQGAVIDELVGDAFAPWGMGTERTTASLLEIYAELTGRPLSRGRQRWERGEPGWRERLTNVRDVLLDALEAGELSCEAVHSIVPSIVEAAPVTLPEPPALAAETTTWFELLVVDEAGEPVSGLEIAFAIAGERATATTNGAGRARADAVAASFGSARVVDPAKVKELLEPRWQSARRVRLPEGDHTSVQPLRSSLAAISVESERPHTLAIVPHHRRVRLVGMHFDTNKSFLVPSAMPGIRRVKALYDEVDATEFLVVGHTDRRGKRRTTKSSLSNERKPSWRS